LGVNKFIYLDNENVISRRRSIQQRCKIHKKIGAINNVLKASLAQRHA
jgi:hypothetical protein